MILSKKLWALRRNEPNFVDRVKQTNGKLFLKKYFTLPSAAYLEKKNYWCQRLKTKNFRAGGVGWW